MTELQKKLELIYDHLATVHQAIRLESISELSSAENAMFDSLGDLYQFIEEDLSEK